MITMRSKHNNLNPHLQKQQKQQKIKSSSAIFLPKLCSASSVKDVHLKPHCRRSSSSEEPSSPKVGCMGQVKRTNKVVAFPSSLLLFKQFDPTHNNHIQNPTKIKPHNNNIDIVKYHNKLKRFFTSKSLTNTPTTATRTTRGGTHKPRIITTTSRNVGVRNNRVRETGVVLLCRSKKMGDEKISRAAEQKGSLVNLEELDPPLPVVKKKLQEEEDEERVKNMNLWKRRSGGTPLKTLQVQVTHPNCSLLPANTL